MSTWTRSHRRLDVSSSCTTKRTRTQWPAITRCQRTRTGRMLGPQPQHSSRMPCHCLSTRATSRASVRTLACLQPNTPMPSWWRYRTFCIWRRLISKSTAMPSRVILFRADFLFPLIWLVNFDVSILKNSVLRGQNNWLQTNSVVNSFPLKQRHLPIFMMDLVWETTELELSYYK